MNIFNDLSNSQCFIIGFIVGIFMPFIDLFVSCKFKKKYKGKDKYKTTSEDSVSLQRNCSLASQEAESQAVARPD